MKVCWSSGAASRIDTTAPAQEHCRECSGRAHDSLRKKHAKTPETLAAEIAAEN